MKSWYKSRTIWIAILTGATGVMVALSTQYPTLGWIVVAKGLLDAMLRLATSSELK